MSKDLSRVVSCITISTVDLARALEAMVGQYFKQPAPGLYLSGSSELILEELVPGQQLVQLVRGGSVPIHSVKDIDPKQGSVVTLTGQRVLSPKQVLRARVRPFLNQHILGLIDNVIHHSIERRAPWIQQGIVNEEVLYHDYLVAGKDTPEYVYTAITQVLAELYEHIDNYLAQFDPWTMHFVRGKGESIRIETTCDYRIYSFMVEHGLMATTSQENRFQVAAYKVQQARNLVPELGSSHFEELITKINEEEERDLGGIAWGQPQKEVVHADNLQPGIHTRLQQTRPRRPKAH